MTPRAVLAVYPIAQPKTTTPSYNAHMNAVPLGRAGMLWFAKHVSRSPAELQDPRINLIAANLNDLPPMTIINAQIDPLRDDGQLLEHALRAAGVSVERRQYDGVAHEFFGMASVLAYAMQAQEFAGQRLRAAFAT